MILTFDCYGTLIDWERGIHRAFVERLGRDPGREAVIDAYHVAEAEVELERYRPYREVLAESARRAAAALGCHAGDGSFLAESLPSWTPFPDTNRALERLAAEGWSLGILSNIDDDLLAETRRHFTVGFELVITAQQVGSYKPAAGHFLAARERIGRRDWLHAAQSWYHDIVPARRLGIRAAWVNRKGEKGSGEVRPELEVRDLAGLVEALRRPEG